MFKLDHVFGINSDAEEYQAEDSIFDRGA